MKDHARAFVLVVGLGLPATVHANPDDEIRTFATSKYTYCDAKLVASLWKRSVVDAKTTIGRKLARKDGARQVDRVLVDARKNAFRTHLRCDYDEAGFSYGDAERLARLWHKSVGDAKTMIEDKVMAGATQMLRDLLKQAPAGNDDDIGAFLKQDRYTYCDAKVIAAMWKQSVEDGKAFIGQKLRTRNAGALRSTLGQARQHAKRNPAARCAFSDAFGFDDAKKLAKLWRISIADVKARVEDKLLAGNELYVRQQLVQANEPDDDIAVFLRQDRYTYCDAKVIAGLWKQSVERSKSYIGAKLSLNNTQAIEATLVRARANARRDPAARCHFHDAGFSYDDAVALAKRWRVNASDAKIRVEDKILAGHEAYVRKLLKR